MLLVVFLIVGLAGIFYLFDVWDIKRDQSRRQKLGEDYVGDDKIKKLGYFTMFAFFAATCLYVSGGKLGGPDFDDSCGVSVRC